MTKILVNLYTEVSIKERRSRAPLSENRVEKIKNHFRISIQYHPETELQLHVLISQFPLIFQLKHIVSKLTEVMNCRNKNNPNNHNQVHLHKLFKVTINFL